jgi:AraC-like DNA-binding protein
MAVTGARHIAGAAAYRRPRSMLADPSNDGRRITDIALARGFNKAAHFNRCSRRRFGCLPTQYRGR